MYEQTDLMIISLIRYRELELLHCWASACSNRPPHCEVTTKLEPTRHLKSCEVVQFVTAALAKTSIDMHKQLLLN